jgi:phospholipid transport system substrate-binding protein
MLWVSAMRKRLLPVLAVVFAALMSVAAFVPYANAGQAVAASPGSAAERFVQQNIDRGYAILRDPKITEAQRQSTFREFALGIMDARRIGLFTLGRYANGAPKADIDAFVDAFADFTAAVYESRLLRYRDQLLTVVGSQVRAEDDVVVNCTATDPNRPDRPPLKVAFRIRKEADAKLTVTDMNIEGIWQTLSHRADFTSFLQQHGGRLSDLVNDLKQQTKSIYAST